MGKPTICETDQHLCFRYTDSTIPLLSTSKISSTNHLPVCVGRGRNPNCWVSHAQAQLFLFILSIKGIIMFTALSLGFSVYVSAVIFK